jgi:hypothetical protein
VLSLLSLGVHPMINGIVHRDVSLPWGWLASQPLLEAGLPLRLSILADGAVAAALAFAIDLAWTRLRQTSLSPRAAAAIVAAVTAVAVAPLIPLPLPATPAGPTPAGWSATLGALRLPAGATVLVVPIPTARLTDVLRWQADTGAPISLVGGYFEGPGQNGQAYIDGSIQPPPLTRYLNDLWIGDVDAPRPAPSLVRASLAGWDPAAVVVNARSHPALRAYLEQLFGPPAVSNGGMLGWRLA